MPSPSDFALPELPNAPDWVVVWESARAVGDTRLLAEQIPALAEACVPIPTEPLTDGDVWIQPGEYEYAGCGYDFAGPVEANRLCVWHPQSDTRQPLERVVIGGMAFMCCLDCASKTRRHDSEDPELGKQVRQAYDWMLKKAQRMLPRKLRPRHPVDEEIPF